MRPIVDLLEYQGKEFLAGRGVPVPEGASADGAAEALVAARALGYPVAVKAQVPVGGRGKAGGIRVVDTPEELEEAAGAVLGLTIGGHAVERLLIEKAMAPVMEWYASFTLDRTAKVHLGMLSARGGVDIEEVAGNEPGAIARLRVSPLDGLSVAATLPWITAAGLSASGRSHGPGDEELGELLCALYRAYVDGDAELVEINPLAVSADGRLTALDAKVTLDDSAAFRHPEWEVWRAERTLDERERRAHERGLNYIGLDGSVGIIGNGAGLVMSTLDVVHQAGGSAANFLDVGGGAGAELIASALEVINSDDRVRAILVNIFGGITRCDLVAQGLLDALGRVELRSSIVVRLDGTNAAEGRALLAANPSDHLVCEPTMADAARRAVALAKMP